MSFRAIAWAFDQDIKPPARKFCLVALASFVDAAGFCWPSFRAIRKMTGLSRRAIISHIQSLHSSGLISKKDDKRPDGSQKSNKYYIAAGDYESILAPQGAMVAPPPVQNLHPLNLSNESITESIPPAPRKRRETETVQPEGFQRFYRAHPKHYNPDDALKAWLSVNPGGKLDEAIVVGAERYASMCANNQTEKRYIKAPGPWLRAGGWKSEYDESESDPCAAPEFYGNVAQVEELNGPPPLPTEAEWLASLPPEHRARVLARSSAP